MTTISYQSAADTIYHSHHIPVEELIFNRDHQSEIIKFLEAVDRIQLSPADGTESGDLNSMAMVRLKHEFLTVLTAQSDPIGTVDLITSNRSSLTSIGYEDYLSVYNSPSDEVILYLRHVAERLNSGGHLGDCIKIYKSVRKPFFRTMMKQLRLEELYMGWNAKRFISASRKRDFYGKS
ncbi:unnamed protein product [Fraxinus pennsylvanica]|uniref:Uncharacterized protein n=1 Tax=Fraxinus pennsylvanica TaxID=56036 RepID=A0AAD2DGM1_9LAMI|nr:unnamed protein product [Fraxinus pennsylvanica]